uniref:Uncharacterized protein n=1 Tax=Plectus sambesii TaxID=2011161 RepID=A0A914UQQ9_9BILA
METTREMATKRFESDFKLAQLGDALTTVCQLEGQPFADVFISAMTDGATLRSDCRLRSYALGYCVSAMVWPDNLLQQTDGDVEISERAGERRKSMQLQ